MNGKKAQAALEFLMTYGWAILVVLIVIGALAYFGVLNPNILVPEKCTLQTGLACKDYRVTSTGVTLDLQNGMGKGIIIKTINISQSGTTGECLNESVLTDVTGLVANGRDTSFYIACPAPGGLQNIGSKVKLDVAIKYYFQDSTYLYNHTLGGEMLVKLES